MVKFRWLPLGIIFVLCISSSSFEEKRYPQDYFRAPVNIPLRLSGTFGELRSNHFHAGIDIKGGIGLPLYAIAEGYVSRIKVQAGGYGKVIYIDHPNGYTSVYAHMNRFSKQLEQYIKDKQHKTTSFEQDLYPPKDSFYFEQGEKIGEMGTTGYSFGPHLHFEIRDTRTEKIINPLLFGFKVPDNKAPRLHQLRVYELNEKNETADASSINLRWDRGGYSVGQDTLMIDAKRIGLALKAYDHMDYVSNWNGIFQMNTFVDDSLHYQFKMETYGFDETRYLNAHIDYEEKVTKNSWFNRCFKLPGNQLSTYSGGDGIIEIDTLKAKKIRIVTSDVVGNASELEFWVKREKPLTNTDDSKPRIFNYVLPYNEESIINNYPLYLYFPRGTFYENLYLDYQVSYEKSHNIYSSIHTIHDYKTPVHQYFEIGIIGDAVPDSLKSKAFIAYCDEDQDIINCGGYWEDGYLKTETRDLGDYCIMLDEKAPNIRPIYFRSDMRRSSRMTFKISDNLLTSGRAKDLRYKGTIDGKWVLMGFDAKNDLLTHNLDKGLESGEHIFRLEVRDDRENVTVFEKKFIR